MTAIPQCIESAKQLYDSRERFHQATALITAIYTESMVIAASLSQLQSLLQAATMQSKPELRSTLDQALTGCWVVYQCLDEEVRDLVCEADIDNLRKRDRVRFLLKEPSLKELLQQIRGQQSALVLLIQGLQMGSLSDMHRLLEDNSAKLDQIAKRSNTLRQTHPSIKVPKSVLSSDNTSDSQTLLGDDNFTFGDEIVNSEAYQKAMVHGLTGRSTEESNQDVKIIDTDPVDMNSNFGEDKHAVHDATDDSSSMQRHEDVIESNHNKPTPQEAESEDEKTHKNMLDDLEKSFLPFMPPASSSRQPSLTVAETQSTSSSHERIQSARTESTSDISKIVSPLEEEPEKTDQQSAIWQRLIEHADQEDERPPPLPPRRSTPSVLASSVPSPSPEPKKESNWNEIFAPLSDTSLSLKDPRLEVKVSRLDSNILSNKPPSLEKKPSHSSLHAEQKDIGAQAYPNETNPGKIWASILSDEEVYIERMNELNNTFYTAAIKEWPALEKHIRAIVLAGELVPLHKEHVLDVVKEQSTQSRFGACDPRLFVSWVEKTFAVLKEYSQRYPHAVYALRLTRTRDKKFGPYVEALNLSLTSIGKSWEDYFELPLKQLHIYITGLQGISRWLDESSSPDPTKEKSRVQSTIEALQRLMSQCSDLMEKSVEQEEIQSLRRRIHTVDTSLVDVLQLTTPTRRIVYQGSLGLKLNNRGPWHPKQVVILDNYLFWGEVKTTKDPKHKGLKTETFHVIDKVNTITIFHF